MIKKIVSVLLVIIWMFIIFSASNDTGVKSSGKSDYIATKIMEIFTHIDKKSPKFNKYKEKIVYPIRKIAHFSEYFILSMLVMNMLLSFNLDKKAILYCIIICVLFAISDEIHQLFIDGRSGQISDVLLDSFGGVVQVLLFKVFKKRGKYETNI